MDDFKNYDFMNDVEKWNMLASVSNLYYNSDMTQNEISERLYISRSKVSRMLKEAKEKGVVEIKINEPWDRDLSSEYELKKMFPNLTTVRIVSSKDKNISSVLQKLGEVSAYYLDSIVNKDTILGISWGNTLYHVVKTIKTNKNIPLTVVPIMGAFSFKNPERDSIDLSKDLASSYGGKCHYIYAPLFLKTKELKDSLIQDEKINESLQLAKKSNLILTSVGSIENKTWLDYLKPSGIQMLSLKGAIGHIGGHFFDENGKEIDTTLKEKMVGITLEDIRNVKEVICVAGMKDKAKAVLGAILGGFINTIITDEVCAYEIIRLRSEQMCNK